jgi:hypothetical protein
MAISFGMTISHTGVRVKIAGDCARKAAIKSNYAWFLEVVGCFL